MRIGRLVAVSFLVVSIVPPLAASSAPDPSHLRPQLAAHSAAPAPQETGHWCGTSDVTVEQQKRLADWARAKNVQRQRSGNPAVPQTGSVRHDDGVFLVTTDDEIAPFDHPADLGNSTLNFTRSGNGFTVQKIALNYDFDLGSATQLLGWQTTPLVLPFQFPFFSGTYGSINIGTNNAIHFGSAQTSTARQFFETDLAMSNFPVAAPLMVPSAQAGTFGYYYTVYVKTSGSAVTITWKNTYPGDEYAKDIQAVLFSNGNIRFSYRNVTNLAGSVIVSSGARSYYAGLARSSVGTATDPSGDASPSVPAGQRSMTDVTGIGVARIPTTNFIEVAINVAAAINQAALGGGSIYYILEFGATSEERAVNSAWVEVASDRISYTPPGLSSSTNGGQVTLSGSSLKVLLQDDMLTLDATTTQLNVWALYGPVWNGDFAPVNPLPLGADGPDISLDFSTFTSVSGASTGPMFEPFTFPVLNVNAVWQRLKDAYGLTNDDTDAVSVYQNFLTDLIFYAGGYATVGNHGDSGVSASACGNCPFSPNVMHLDRLGRGWNASQSGAMTLLAHEFGHRWLYFIKLMESGIATNNLNPDGAHPRQGAHLPAAYPVVGSYDVSTMGGGYFTQTGPSTYVTPAQMDGTGYSWNELYLMGLAAVNEVNPWFYLTGNGLDGWYNAAWNTTFTIGSRKEATLAQVVSAIGARSPVYPNAKKNFKNLYVILERAGQPVSDAAIDTFRTNYVLAFTTRFAAITGGRGTVTHVTAAAGSGSQVKGDFNSDGKSDLVWRNTVTGQTVVWLMNGTTYAGEAALPSVSSSAWTISGTDDFNDDGHPDLVWRNASTFQTVVWLLDGTSYAGEAALPGVSSSAWRIAGTGDFNSDGHPDLVWQNSTTFQTVVWLMNGTAYAGEAALPTVSSTAWSIRGVGDFNSDNKPDLVWRNSTTFQTVVWLMNGTAYAGEAALPNVSSAAWNIDAIGDYNSDGKSDLVWRNASTFQTVVWLLNGTVYLGEGALPGVSSASWQLVAPR